VFFEFEAHSGGYRRDAEFRIRDTRFADNLRQIVQADLMVSSSIPHADRATIASDDISNVEQKGTAYVFAPRF
jgi:hypothetical protein